MSNYNNDSLTADRPLALTSRLTGKTPEGLPVDQFPNRFLPYTCDEIVAGQGGGRLWCDQISRPTQKNVGTMTDAKKIYR